MSKFSLISNLEEDAVSPKKKFQLFEVKMGFEQAEVLIPFDAADDFLNEAQRQKPKSRASLKKLAKTFGGEVQ